MYFTVFLNKDDDDDDDCTGGWGGGRGWGWYVYFLAGEGGKLLTEFQENVPFTAVYRKLTGTALFSLFPANKEKPRILGLIYIYF